LLRERLALIGCLKDETTDAAKTHLGVALESLVTRLFVQNMESKLTEEEIE